MTARRALKLTHLTSTIWFIVCVGYILALALREVGFHWWLIFSLSGHSALAIFLLVSVYLFAVFRGVGGSQQIAVEHPLTTTAYYMGFYVATPLLGPLAGVLAAIGPDTSLSGLPLGVAMGTLATTFSVWVIIDPLVGLIEMLLPGSRRHRAQRLAQAEAHRRARLERRERLLAEAFARERQERQRWQEALMPHAKQLAALVVTDDAPTSRLAEQEAAEIGAKAWQLGGLNCMRQLRDMTMAESKANGARNEAVDYVSYWWDGIGDWRKPSMPNV
jgi:hypothetical protein